MSFTMSNDNARNANDWSGVKRNKNDHSLSSVTIRRCCWERGRRRKADLLRDFDISPRTNFLVTDCILARNWRTKYPKLIQLYSRLSFSKFAIFFTKRLWKNWCHILSPSQCSIRISRGFACLCLAVYYPFSLS